MRKRLSRRSERGTTVLVVVMVTTLITGIGIFAVRNMSQIDQAVGFSRQSSQTNAIAELGTTAAMAQVISLGSYYSSQMDLGYKCLANGPYATTLGSTCYRMSQSEIETNTTAHSGTTLLQPAASGESGSMGPLANTTGVVSIEMTEKYKTFTPKPGSVQGNASDFDVTLTTTADVRPISTSTDPCGASVPNVTAKKVLRAHAIIPGQPGGS